MGDLYANILRTDEHGHIWLDSKSNTIQTEKNNYIYVGNTNPKYVLSWRNEFFWRGISLGFMINARVGGTEIFVGAREVAAAEKSAVDRERRRVYGLEDEIPLRVCDSSLFLGVTAPKHVYDALFAFGDRAYHGVGEGFPAAKGYHRTGAG